MLRRRRKSRCRSLPVSMSWAKLSIPMANRLPAPCTAAAFCGARGFPHRQTRSASKATIPINRGAVFYHPDRNVAGYFKLAGAPPKDLTIKLQPAGGVRGRLVDDQAQPLADFKFNGEGVPSENFGDAKLRIGTDTDGKFEIRGLLPGRKYSVDVYGGIQGGNFAIDPVEAGQTKDLGDVKLAPPQINGMVIAPRPSPEPKSKDDTKAEGDGAKLEVGSRSGLAKADDDLITVHGQALDPVGKPVAGAEVMAVHWFWKTTRHSIPLTTVKSDEQGQFHLEFHKSQLDPSAADPANSVAIVARSPGSEFRSELGQLRIRQSRIRKWP